MPPATPAPSGPVGTVRERSQTWSGNGAAGHLLPGSLDKAPWEGVCEQSLSAAEGERANPKVKSGSQYLPGAFHIAENEHVKHPLFCSEGTTYLRRTGGGGKKKNKKVLCGFFYRNCNSYTIVAFQPHAPPQGPYKSWRSPRRCRTNWQLFSSGTAAVTAQGQMLTRAANSALKTIVELSELSPRVS